MKHSLKVNHIYYICFDDGIDEEYKYFRMLKDWEMLDNDIMFIDGLDLRNDILPISEDEAKVEIDYRMQNIEAFILLIGTTTRYLSKHVYWEMEKAVELNKPIIAVNINGFRSMDKEKCPPIIQKSLSLHICFNRLILNQALQSWPMMHTTYFNENAIGPFYFGEDFYSKLGL